jgi:hypothetical protein
MPQSPLAADLKNQLLASLLKLDHDLLLPQLHQVDLVQGDVIYSADGNIETVYFPETAGDDRHQSTVESRPHRWQPQRRSPGLPKNRFMYPRISSSSSTSRIVSI